MSRVRLGTQPHAFAIAVAIPLVVALFALCPGAARAAESAPREAFVVEPFVNTKGVRSFDHMRLGLPAFIAERLANFAPLRHVGPPDLLSRAPAGAGAKWAVSGEFERRPDWRVAVTVRVRSLAAPEEVVSQATKEGTKDDVAKVAMEAALAAFGGLPGLRMPPAPPAVTAPFGRDPYAFVLYGRGIAAYQGKGSAAVRAERALVILKRCLLVDPKVPESRRYVGFIHLHAGRPAQARSMWSYAVDLRPDYVAAVGALAALDRSAGLPTARERYARLVELDPEDVDARRVHGELLSEAGRLEEAQAELERVLKATPTDLRARRALALVLAARRAGKELAAELEELVRLDPESLEARMDLGAAYMSIGKQTDAAAVYDEVLRRRPKHAGALKLAADLARTQGDLKKAATYYGKLRYLTPQDPRPVFLMAAAQYDAGNLDQAERLFTEGSQYPGMIGEAYSNLGAIALRRGDPKQALWFLSRAAKRRPARATVRFNHALALHKLGRSADALNELKAAEGADPNDAGVRFLAGVVCLRLGLLQEAEGYFRETLKLQPGYEDARHNLALLEPLVSPKREGSVSFINGGVPLVPAEPATKPAVERPARPEPDKVEGGE